jgi:CMP-N,N'-diacetyllegionaminic acid synthase
MMKDQTVQPRVVGIVPARAGSKGITRKNIRLMAGKPLLSYTATAALSACRLSRVLLSTDDPEIAAIGSAAGLEVPFLRPGELALDSTPMVEVVLHAIGWLQARGQSYDAVCLLQPTSPLRSASTIDRCIALLWERDVDSVISVRPVPAEYNPHWVYFENAAGLLEPSISGAEIPCRQQLPHAYHPDGSVFVARTPIVISQRSLKGKRTLGAVSPEQEAADLDTEEQWQTLEQRLKHSHDPAGVRSAR